MRLAVATSMRTSTRSADPFAPAANGPPEPLDERPGGASARLGQQDPEAPGADPDRAIGLARLGPDGVADDPRDPVADAGRRLAAELDEQDRRRAAVAGVTRRLVPEGGHPVGTGVELDRSPDARVRRRRRGVVARPGRSRKASICSAVRPSSRSS